MLRVAIVSFALLATAQSSHGDEYLGNLSGNQFDGESINNEFAPINNPYNANSLTNRFGPYGNHFSPYSPYNRFSTNGPAIYGTADE